MTTFSFELCRSLFCPPAKAKDNILPSTLRKRFVSTTFAIDVGGPEAISPVAKFVSYFSIQRGPLGSLSIPALAFLMVERFVTEPLLPLDLFRNQVFAVSGLLALLGGMVFYAVNFYLPLLIQGVLGQAATTSGASLTPLFIPIAVSAVLGGQVSGIVGCYRFLAVGGALLL